MYDGRLPVHVHFVMDEFANLSLPDDFDKILSVMRSREVSVSIILQNMAQLKALFEKQWESITGNCDEFLYLGGNEQSTHKYVSEMLGKETIDTNNYNRSYGRNGSYSTGYQLSGRELLDASEVRMLDNAFAILFIRGERAVKDLKYDILNHPNVMFSEDGGAEPYEHGIVTCETRDIVVEGVIEPDGENAENEIQGRQKVKTSHMARRIFVIYVAAVIVCTMFAGICFAANDTIAVVNNLSTFIFSLIRAIGLILLGFGIVQVGLSLKSHDPSQRANGFLTLAGGVIITFTKEILNLITG